jgi:DNA repair ATPase RecN
VTADQDKTGPAAGPDSVSGQAYAADMADANVRIDHLKEDLDAIGSSVLDLLAKARAHDAKLKEVQKALDLHTSNFDRVDSRLGGIDSRLDRVDSRLDRVDSRLGGIDSRLEGHDSRFDHVDAQLAEILARLPDPAA